MISLRQTLRLLCVAFLMHAGIGYGQEMKIDTHPYPLYNIDLYGSDIAHITLETPSSGMLDTRETQCSAMCSNNIRCVAWTYERPTGAKGSKATCHLKDKIPEATKNSCCISGTVGKNTNTWLAGKVIKRYGGEQIFNPEKDYNESTSDLNFSSSFNLTSQVTANRCRKSCFEDSRCLAWTFVKPTNNRRGECLLIDPAPSAGLKIRPPHPKKDKCCISGSFKIEQVK